MEKRGVSAVLIGLLAGCGGGERYDRPLVSDGLRERTGAVLGPPEGGVPPGVSLDDGVTEDEAVALALWNNAAFQEVLAELGVRRADIVAAGQIPNPVLSVLFPLSPKQLEFTAKLPLEFLWLRPARVAAAEFDAERVASLLTQGGLDLIRDVRLAYADLSLAEARRSGATRLAGLRSDALGLAESRLRAGDASEAEVTLARADAAEADVERDRAAKDLEALRPRLEELLGLRDGPPREFRAALGRSVSPAAEPALVELAYRSRPDLQAARAGLDAAGERADLSDLEILALTAVLDANQPKGPDGLEVGPGVDVAIPLFNQNQGNRARAVAELERAARRYAAARDLIALEVRVSRAALVSAQEARDALDAKVRPAMAEALAAARKAFDAGETSSGPVLELEARSARVELRRAEVEAERRRALANVERNVGRRLP